MLTVVILITVLAVAALFIWIVRKAKKLSLEPVPGQEKILTLTEENFSREIRGKLILVDFWAEWCMPCRMMAPMLAEVANELDDKGFVGKVDIEKYNSLSTKYNVQSIPTLILFKNGKEVRRFVGVKTRSFLLQQLKTA